MNDISANIPNDNKPKLRIKWTDDEIKFVVDKQREGFSAGVIAKMMTELGMRADCTPITRNAVVSVWQRHREKLVSINQLQIKTRLKRTIKKIEETEEEIPVVFEPSFHIEERMNELVVESVEPKKMTIETLKEGCCRFPFNDPRNEDFYYCGEPVDYSRGRSYCKFHYKICYMPPENRR